LLWDCYFPSPLFFGLKLVGPLGVPLPHSTVSCKAQVGVTPSCNFSLCLPQEAEISSLRDVCDIVEKKLRRSSKADDPAGGFLVGLMIQVAILCPSPFCDWPTLLYPACPSPSVTSLRKYPSPLQIQAVSL
jgi:hypothetical protein